MTKVIRLLLHMCMQSLLLVCKRAVSVREKELGFYVLLRLSSSVAVHNMTTLKGNIYQRHAWL